MGGEGFLNLGRHDACYFRFCQLKGKTATTRRQNSRNWDKEASDMHEPQTQVFPDNVDTPRFICLNLGLLLTRVNPGVPLGNSALMKF